MEEHILRTVLMIDLNNMAIRALFSDREMINNPSPDFALHKHQLINSIFNNIRKYQPDEIILAIDDRKNWRKSVYADYKANRKEKRDADIFPWDQYYAYMDEFLPTIKAIFPFKMLQVPYCEADDTIAVIAKHLTTSKNIIITSDSDYIQLLKLPNVEIFDPFKNKVLTESDPHKCLMVKILSGDAGDNVPNIRPRLGPKTAEKILANNELEELLKDEELNKAFIRNRMLIDWDYIPNVAKKSILDAYNSYPALVQVNAMQIMNFFINHRLRKLNDDFGQIKNLIYRLYLKEEDYYKGELERPEKVDMEVYLMDR